MIVNHLIPEQAVHNLHHIGPRRAVDRVDLVEELRALGVSIENEKPVIRVLSHLAGQGQIHKHSDNRQDGKKVPR